MGVIAVDTRAVEVTVPADPGNPNSEAQVSVSADKDWCGVMRWIPHFWHACRAIPSISM